MYPERELNPHGRNGHRILSPACLPIPPPGQIGAGNGTRIRDPDLGKVVLYQLSYSRLFNKTDAKVIIFVIDQRKCNAIFDFANFISKHTKVVWHHIHFLKIILYLLLYYKTHKKCFMHRISLPLQILIAIIIGISLGYFFPASVDYVGWMGELFLKALKMIVIPLIILSIITGIIQIGPDAIGKTGFKALSLFIISSLMAILSGLFLSHLIKPGKFLQDYELQITDPGLNSSVSLKEMLMNIIPENFFAALVNENMLGILFVSVIVGIFVQKTGRTAKKTLSYIFNSFFKLILIITSALIKLTPLGVLGLMTKLVVEQKELMSMASGLAMFGVVMVIGLLLHSLVTLPLLVRFLGKARPFKHLPNMSEALITGFSTASSAAALPLNMKNLQEKSGVSERITNFTLPIGATINMDGTAIYLTVSILFFAQALGIDLSFGQQLVLIFTALISAIGAAGVPMASLVLMSLMMTVLGLPIEMIALLLPFDRLVDMLRTTTNVWSDSCIAVILAKSEGEELKV